MNSGKSRYLSGCREAKVGISFYFLPPHTALKICNQNKFGNKCSMAYIIGGGEWAMRVRIYFRRKTH